MRGWMLFGFYLFTLSAGAEPFARYSSLPKKQKVDTQAAAVVHLKIDEGESCTGGAIGSAGEILTNLHCVERCLTNAGVVSSSDLGNDVAQNTVNLTKPVRCQGEVLFFSEKSPRTLNIEVAKVFGPGFLGPRENLPAFAEQQPAKFKELLEAGFEGYGDMVLLRVPVAQPTACARVEAADWSRETPAQVFNLAYPVVFRRDGSGNPMASSADLFTIGRTLLLSKGEATTALDRIGGYTPAERKFIETWMAPQTFLSSVDVEGGSSGSPVFSQNGRVVGLLRSTFNPRGANYRAWMAEGVDIGPKISAIASLVPSNGECP